VSSFSWIVLIGLAVISVGVLSALPAWLLWRMKGQWRYPIAWWGIVVLLLGLAAVTTKMQIESFPTPVPIRETLADVADRSGQVVVTGLRLSDPTVRDARIEVDVENAGAHPVALGLQYVADGGILGSETYSPGSTMGALVHPVEPEWGGTVAYDVTLPGFAFGGNIVIAIALCPDGDLPEGAAELPPDSEAIFQERFVLVPEPEIKENVR